MIYNLTTDNDKNTGTIPDGIDIRVPQMSRILHDSKKVSPLNILGQGLNSYGEDLQNNFYYLLQNFCGDTEPSKPIVGMLWFDATLKLLKLYTGKEYPKGPWMIVDFEKKSTPPEPSPKTKSLTWSKSSFSEKSTRDGVDGYVQITTSGLKFKDNVLTTDINIKNVPAGLIPNITKITNGIRISFTGNATTKTNGTINFNILGTAFDPKETDMVLVSNSSYSVDITFLPNIEPTGSPELNHKFINLQSLYLIGDDSKRYDIIYDMVDSRYICMDGPSIVDYGVIFDLLLLVMPSTIATNSGNNQYEWVVNDDNSNALHIFKFSPTGGIASSSFNIIKMEVIDKKLKLSKVTSSTLDETCYVINNTSNVGKIEKSIHSSYNIDGTLIQKGNEKFSTGYMLTYINGKYYYLNESDEIYNIDGTKLYNNPVYTNPDAYPTSISLYKMSKHNSIHMNDVTKPILTIINYGATDTVLPYDILTEHAKSFINEVGSKVNNISYRVVEFIPNYYHIYDIQYNGLKDANTDIFHVIIGTNHKSHVLSEKYRLLTLEIPHTITKISDITAKVEEGLSTIYKTSINNIVLNDAKISEVNIFKFCYYGGTGGLILNNPPA